MCNRGVNKRAVICIIPYPLLQKSNWERFQNTMSTFSSLRNAYNVSRNDEYFVHFAHLLSQNNLDSAIRPRYTDSNDIITRTRIKFSRRSYQMVPLLPIVMNTGQFLDTCDCFERICCHHLQGRTMIDESHCCT